MEKKNIIIGDKEYTVEIAKSKEDKEKGLQDRDYLAPDEGMLFVYEEQQPVGEYLMKNTKIPLDQIAINEDNEVTTVYKAQPNSENLHPFANVKYLLEVNQDSGIVEGDDFEFDNSDDPNKYVMKVLAPDGSTQMSLQGGERIFSRISTKQMITWAKKAEANKDNKELFAKYCKRLGKRMFKELYAQDHRDPEYVEAPDKKDQKDKK